jgi:hypothetical protein
MLTPLEVKEPQRTLCGSKDCHTGEPFQVKKLLVIGVVHFLFTFLTKYCSGNRLSEYWKHSLLETGLSDSYLWPFLKVNGTHTPL